MLKPDPYSLPLHSFFVTFFADKFAATQLIDTLTLEQLAALIMDTRGASKAVLPWLKLAKFGDVKTDKGSLRSNANMLSLTGVEAEHDAGTMTFEEAAEALQIAKIRCLVYTTPSHMTGVKERWRVLAPLSETMPTTARAALVARLNGVLGGCLAPESFTLSQAYLYGNCERLVIVDGDFVDLADDLEAGAIGKHRVGPKAGAIERPRALDAVGHDDDEIQAKLEKTRIKGHWHTNMISVTSILAGRGWSVDDICAHCADYADQGADDPELVDKAKTAVGKYGVGLPREAQAKLAEDMLKLKADTEAEDAPEIMFTPPVVVTQDAIALIFAEEYANQLQFDHHAGAWYVWTGSHWKREATLLAFHYSRELGRKASKGSNPAGMKEARKISFAGGVEKFARADRRIAATSERWDRDGYLLGTPGGTIDLRTGQLKRSDPADGITRLTAIAPTHGAPRPLWDKFLNETFGGDAELIRFIKQWFGYCLTGDTREHALWFGFGSGGNGKGVLLNTIHAVLGSYAVTAAMETFTASKWDRHPTEIAMLRGARLVTASETEKDRAWAESRIKQLTGGDPITARFMHRDFFTFQPEFKLALIGNHKPVLRNVDDAVRRRFNLVPFMNKPAVVDKQLERKLRAEWGAILAWMVEGCLDWQANGLIQPAAVKAATEKYFEDQDPIGQWLAERCEDKPRHVETSAAVFVSWEDFARHAGEEPGTRRAFTNELARRGYETVRTKKSRDILGLRLVKSEDQIRKDEMAAAASKRMASVTPIKKV